MPNKTMKNRAALRVLKRFVRMTITKRGDGNRWRINEKPRISQANHDGGETKRTTKEGADKRGTAFLPFASFSHTGAKRIKEFMDSSTSTPQRRTNKHQTISPKFGEKSQQQLLQSRYRQDTFSPFRSRVFLEKPKKEKHGFVFVFFFFFQFLTFSQTFLSFFFLFFLAQKPNTDTETLCSAAHTVQASQTKTEKRKKKKEKRKKKKRK